MPTGVRSFSTSKVSLLNRAGAAAIVPMSVISMVWPSFSALATKSAPMLPEAPTLFSTTTGWPMAFDRWGPISRARMSEEPPGAYGTMSLTGL
jgi:hypothetical protein